MPLRIGLLGDEDERIAAHVAIGPALRLAGLPADAEVTWLATSGVATGAVRLAGLDGLWAVPGSPYASFEGALRGIRWARESGTPFLGTCGGFQHVVIEYARHALGFQEAQHAEYDPDASRLFITGLGCSLVGQTMEVRVVPGSRAGRAYCRATSAEEYYCTFGLNPAYQTLLHEGGLRVVGVDQDGEARIVELAGNSRLMQFIKQLGDQVHRFGLLTLRHGRAERALQEHGEIIEALVRRDGDTAEALMRDHLRADRDLALRITLPAGFIGTQLAG